jgi:hypothetical protein
MYRTEIVKEIIIESTAGFEVIVEMIVKSFLAGYKITEIPTIWKDLNITKSNFKLLKWLPKYLHWYLIAVFKKGNSTNK